MAGGCYRLSLRVESRMIRLWVAIWVVELAIGNVINLGPDAQPAQTPTIDQIFATVAGTPDLGKVSRQPGVFEEAKRVNNGKGFLIELDIVEPAVCELRRRDLPSAHGRANHQGHADLGVRVQSAVPEGDGDCSGALPNYSETNNVPHLRSKRNIYFNPKYHWKTTTIPYSLYGNFSDDELDVLSEAIADYTKYTCIKWEERDDLSKGYVEIIREDACWSYIGFQSSTKPQQLSLGVGCLKYKRTAIHELYHVLGNFHQQSRPDRDRYVTINKENIATGWERNFVKYPSRIILLFKTKYSYRSVMHYGPKFFNIKDGSNKDTITTKDPKYQTIIGKAPTFSFEDLQLLHQFVKCDANCSEPDNCPVPNGYRGKDCKCYCKTDEINPNIPVVECAQVVCDKINKVCNCGAKAGACGSLQNSECSNSTNACECRTGYYLHGGSCKLLDDIECRKVGEQCYCSDKSSTACGRHKNAACDPISGSCTCKTGFTLIAATGKCKAYKECTRPNKKCMCSAREGACKRLDHTICDKAKDKCVCEIGYRPWRGKCVPYQACRRLDQRCRCQKRGLIGCSRFMNSACDHNSGKCKCFYGFKKIGWRSRAICQSDCPNYVSDGSKTLPFKATGSIIFQVNKGQEPVFSSKAYNISHNSHRLRAAGSNANEFARLETPKALGRGQWCIYFAALLNKAALVVEISTDGTNWKPIRGISSTANLRNYAYRTYRLTSTNDRFMIAVKASAYPFNRNGDWEVNIDPVIVKRCKDTCVVDLLFSQK